MDSSSSAGRTSPTLLMRLAESPRDEMAWSAFVAMYGKQLRRWCLHWGLQEADADDVTQRVLLDLAQQLPDFVYDRTKCFRAWLKTVAHRAWQKYIAALSRPGRGTGESDVAEMLGTVEARDDLAARLDKEFDLELLEAAMAVVKQRVQPTTWEAFYLLAIEKRSGTDVATTLGLSVDAAFKAKSNVTKLLREEMRQAEG